MTQPNMEERENKSDPCEDESTLWKSGSRLSRQHRRVARLS